MEAEKLYNLYKSIGISPIVEVESAEFGDADTVEILSGKILNDSIDRIDGRIIEANHRKMIEFCWWNLDFGNHWYAYYDFLPLVYEFAKQ